MKIFFIGFNKTGSTSFHQFFIENNFKSLHSSSWWYFDQKQEFGHYDFYLDGFEHLTDQKVFPNLPKLLEYFPKAKFILNTRNLDNWILSRLNHRSRDYLTKEHQQFDMELILDWVKTRNEWYKTVFQFFQDKPDKLLVVNLEKDGNTKTTLKLEKFLNINFINKEIKIHNQSSASIEKKQRNRWTVDRFLSTYIVWGYFNNDLETPITERKIEKKIH